MKTEDDDEMKSRSDDNEQLRGPLIVSLNLL